MPKEVIREFPNKKSAWIEVRWGAEHFDRIQIVVDRHDKFKFLNDEEDEVYTTLGVTLLSEQDVNDLIKALEKAKRQTEF